MGIIAEERQQFDQAEQWYKKALEIFERLGHPPLLVNTLAQIGVLRKKQNQLREAVSWFGKALAIATEYEMRVSFQIMADLARILKIMGEKEFTTAWQQVFSGQPPPIEALRKVMAMLEEGSE